MASMNPNHELALLRQRVTELERSEARYRGAFESSPVSLWEQDWTAVKAHLEPLVASGVTDLDAYLRSHPSEVLACVGMVRVVV
jgi:rsbT co-antagonist protein RsbR